MSSYSKINVCLGVFIFQMGTTCTHNRESQWGHGNVYCIGTEESDYIIIRVFFWSEYFSPLLRTFPKAQVECPYYHLHLL